MKKFLLIGGVLFLIAISRANAGDLKTSKGRNNPGNIKNFGGAKFKGETTKSGDAWKSFDTPANGYRAIMVILRTYYGKGFTTIRQIISRYAPGSENPTEAYIGFVSNAAGIPADADAKKILYSDGIKKIAQAITKFEQGTGFAVNDQHLADAYKNLA